MSSFSTIAPLVHHSPLDNEYGLGSDVLSNFVETTDLEVIKRVIKNTLGLPVDALPQAVSQETRYNGNSESAIRDKIVEIYRDILEGYAIYWYGKPIDIDGTSSSPSTSARNDLSFRSNQTAEKSVTAPKLQKLSPSKVSTKIRTIISICASDDRLFILERISKSGKYFVTIDNFPSEKKEKGVADLQRFILRGLGPTFKSTHSDDSHKKILLDGRGSIVIFDAENCHLHVLNQMCAVSSSFIGSNEICSTDLGNQGAEKSINVATDESHIYFLDAYNHKVFVCDWHLIRLKSFDFPVDCTRPVTKNHFLATGKFVVLISNRYLVIWSVNGNIILNQNPSDIPYEKIANAFVMSEDVIAIRGTGSSSMSFFKIYEKGKNNQRFLPIKAVFPEKYLVNFNLGKDCVLKSHNYIHIVDPTSEFVGWERLDPIPIDESSDAFENGTNLTSS